MIYNRKISFSLQFSSSPHRIITYLTKPELLVSWFCDKITSNIITGKSIIGNWSNSKLLISQKTKTNIIWDWYLPHIGRTAIHFKIETLYGQQLLKIQHSGNFPISLQHYTQDWLIKLYKLKFIIDITAGEGNNDLNYSPRYSKPLTLFTHIKAPAPLVYSILMTPKKLNIIVSDFAEVDFNSFKYDYGWIGDGPSNLLWYHPNRAIVHDWFHDTRPMGSIHWIIQSDDNNQTCLLQFKHIQLDLTNEYNQLRTYIEYRHGWLHLLQKIKMLAEFDDLEVYIDIF